jgi:hypothetical protein
MCNAHSHRRRSSSRACATRSASGPTRGRTSAHPRPVPVIDSEVVDGLGWIIFTLWHALESSSSRAAGAATAAASGAAAAATEAGAAAQGAEDSEPPDAKGGDRSLQHTWSRLLRQQCARAAQRSAAQRSTRARAGRVKDSDGLQAPVRRGKPAECSKPSEPSDAQQAEAEDAAREEAPVPASRERRGRATGRRSAHCHAAASAANGERSGRRQQSKRLATRARQQRR